MPTHHYHIRGKDLPLRNCLALLFTNRFSLESKTLRKFKILNLLSFYRETKFLKLHYFASINKSRASNKCRSLIRAAPLTLKSEETSPFDKYDPPIDAAAQNARFLEIWPSFNQNKIKMQMEPVWKL